VSTTDRERAVRRCRSLLAKAESTTFEPERAALREKAEELMSRHGLALSDLAEQPRLEPVRPAPRPTVIFTVQWGGLGGFTSTASASTSASYFVSWG